MERHTSGGLRFELPSQFPVYDFSHGRHFTYGPACTSPLAQTSNNSSGWISVNTILEVSQLDSSALHYFKPVNKSNGFRLSRQPRRSNRPMLYYSNSVATQRLLLANAGDIEENPGPKNKPGSISSKWKAPRCTVCERVVAKNHKRLACDVCYDLTHAGCSNPVQNLKTFSSTTPVAWTCPRCTLNCLPFHDANLSDSINSPLIHNADDIIDDLHLKTLKDKGTQLKIMHINTQSMVSTFDNLLIVVQHYSLDVITMSETWLKSNSLLLQHVTIPGYVHAFNNRDNIRGGGVGIYIKESINFKRRSDIEARYPSMEHLWVEISGRNKNSKSLLGTLYRSETMMNYSDWLGNFESLLSDLTLSWDGMLLITGDFNVDLLNESKPATKKYKDVLAALNLQQLVTKPTRTTRHSATLIDHIVTNLPQRVTHTDVLPCPLISDHDAPYATVNVRVTRFAPRHKFIRNERNFDEEAFIRDFAKLPLSLVYAVDDPDMQVDMLNTLFSQCLNEHAPLKRTKLSRPPAPWMKDLNIQDLQQECSSRRAEAHKGKSESTWVRYRESRNRLKSTIKKSKRDFYQRALSSTKPKEVWKVIHNILHPSPQPLRSDPDELNKHFASTAQRVTGASPESVANLWKLIDSLPEDKSTAFSRRKVLHHEVLFELKKLRSDCSCGPDNIPVKFIKTVADQLASPMTHILNSCLSKHTFPTAWKVARITAIPKVKHVKSNDDLRPISILPVLSKVYERVVLHQMASFPSNANTSVLKDSLSAYRKGHTTTTVMLAMRDDILRAMKRGEVTMAVLADFSKAFDTVAYETVLAKLHKLGFSKSYLKWVTNYLTGRKQYVQIDDKPSQRIDVTFGVPQGSILGPVLFNLYVNDLSDRLDSVTSHQYADDTYIYTHGKPTEVKDCEETLQRALDKLTSWSNDSNLVLNPKKTKVMLFSTSQLARAHHLDDYTTCLSVGGRQLEKITTACLLGTETHQQKNIMLLWHVVCHKETQAFSTLFCQETACGKPHSLQARL